MRRLLKKIGNWIRRWWFSYLASNPVPASPLPAPEVPKVTDVMNEYEVIEYNGQRINLHRKRDLPKWKLMNRQQKRLVSDLWEKKEKRGEVRFETINGKLICIKNADYAKRATKEAEKQARHEL